jgi:uncharacterized protein with GYD domain
MPSYLVQAKYAPATLASLVKHPTDRSQILKGAVAKLGGSVEAFWFCFGEYDVLGIVTLPDNVSAVALTMGIGATGTFQDGKSTPLLSVQEGIAAMTKAGSLAS